MEKRITIIGGAYGSGKTEFALAYAVKQAEAGLQTGLVDLDVVNPYFRSRDLAEEFSSQGIEVVSTEPGLEYSDIPALSPRIYGLLQDPAVQRVVLDVGGDPVGARILGRFHSVLKEGEYDFWMVVNPFRPGTRDPEAIEQLLQEIEQTSRLRINGLISNINLGNETDLAIWQEGFQVMEAVKERLQLPLIHQMVAEKFYHDNQDFFADKSVFSVAPRLNFPWMTE